MDPIEFANKMDNCKKSITQDIINNSIWFVDTKHILDNPNDLVLKARYQATFQRDSINYCKNTVIAQSEKTPSTTTHLPATKDPALIKKHAEAEAAKKQAELEETTLKTKDEAIQQLKNKINELEKPVLAFPPKIPIIDPKILAFVSFATQAKELIKKRKEASKKNVTTGKEVYKFPMKLSKETVKLPEIPIINNIT